MNDDLSRKYFDVARPNRSAPSPTSRPVITGPQQPDPLLHQALAVQLTPQPPTDQSVAAETAVAAPEPTPAPAPEAPALAEPATPANQPDSESLLLSAHQNFKPPKATKNRGKRLVVVVIVLIVLAVVALGVYPLLR